MPLPPPANRPQTQEAGIIQLRFLPKIFFLDTIHLAPEDTKTNEARPVPLTWELIEMFKAMPRGLPGSLVFLRNGKPITSIREAFQSACYTAGLDGFNFHDLRHTFINNRRLEGHDYFKIMACTGHKTMSVFKRYNTVSGSCG
jgi:integrase